jgi:hypothetical protein
LARKKKSTLDSFHAAFGEGSRYRDFTVKDESRLSGRLAPVMLELLKNDGWSSYNDQVFWLCDPDDWKPAAQAWFPDNPKAFVLGRSAFGELLAWDGEMFTYVHVHEALIIALISDADWLLSRVLVDKEFPLHNTVPGLVRKARERLGTLEWNQMYTYVPALALGGSPETSRVEKVKALEALVMLASLAPIRRM